MTNSVQVEPPGPGPGPRRPGRNTTPGLIPSFTEKGPGFATTKTREPAPSPAGIARAETVWQRIGGNTQRDAILSSQIRPRRYLCSSQEGNQPLPGGDLGHVWALETQRRKFAQLRRAFLSVAFANFRSLIRRNPEPPNPGQNNHVVRRQILLPSPPAGSRRRGLETAWPRRCSLSPSQTHSIGGPDRSSASITPQSPRTNFQPGRC